LAWYFNADTSERTLRFSIQLSKISEGDRAFIRLEILIPSLTRNGRGRFYVGQIKKVENFTKKYESRQSQI